VTRQWLPAPCWVLVAPDGEIGAWCREGEWDGTHYETEVGALADKAHAVEVDVENGEGEAAARSQSLHAAKLRTSCHVVACDGCGGTYEEDGIRIHFLTEGQLAGGWTEQDGAQHCRYCPALTPEVHVPGLGEDPLPGLELP